jgi:hypothetical protein
MARLVRWGTSLNRIERSRDPPGGLWALNRVAALPLIARVSEHHGSW